MTEVLQLRAWQAECEDRFIGKVRSTERTSFVLNACVASGKSTEAALLTRRAIKEDLVDFVIVFVPTRNIQGDPYEGMLGTFGRLGVPADRGFFLDSRVPRDRQPRPNRHAAIVTYQTLCPELVRSVQRWVEAGVRVGFICDEYHHLASERSEWQGYVAQFQAFGRFVSFFSGTPFRGDGVRIGCVPLDADGHPVADYELSYAEGVRQRIVRPATVQWWGAEGDIHDAKTGKVTRTSLEGLGSGEQRSKLIRAVFQPSAPSVRLVIEAVHRYMTELRKRFPDAGCLLVCPPGFDSQSDNRYLTEFAQRVEQICRVPCPTVMHKDRDAQGMLNRWRNGQDMYLGSISMLTEGFDAPRIRAIVFLRPTDSVLLFRQLAGRALRMTGREDGTAAQLWVPRLSPIQQFAEELWFESDLALVETCLLCGNQYCQCPCTECGEFPCICPTIDGGNGPERYTATAVEAQLLGGTLADEYVPQEALAVAMQVAASTPGLEGLDPVQLAVASRRITGLAPAPLAAVADSGNGADTSNPVVEQEELREEIVRLLNGRVYMTYGKAPTKEQRREPYQEFQRRFGVWWGSVRGIWSSAELRNARDAILRWPVGGAP